MPNQYTAKITGTFAIEDGQMRIRVTHNGDWQGQIYILANLICNMGGKSWPNIVWILGKLFQSAWELMLSDCTTIDFSKFPKKEGDGAT